MLKTSLLKNYLPLKHVSKRKKLIVFLILLSIAIILAFSKKSSDKDTETSASLTITSATATQTKWPKTIVASGSITASQEAIIGTEIVGQRLVEVLVNVGDIVKKGQVLARYNTDMLQAQKAELEANWVQAESDRKRAETLKKSGAMSLQLIESYVNKADVAKARLEAKNVELRYAAIISPDDGVISSRTATLGSVGNAGSELFRLIVRNQYEWRGELTATQLASIAPGQFIKLSLPNGNTARAKVRQLSPSFNAETRMATIYADIEPNNQVHAGMYADGLIEMGLSNVVSVPAESVIIRDGYNYVYKLVNNEKQTKVKQQIVTTGQHFGNQVEIITGLNSGERIVAKGAGFLNDGDIVRLAPDADVKS